MKKSKKRSSAKLKNPFKFSRSGLWLTALLFAVVGGVVIYQSFALGTDTPRALFKCEKKQSDIANPPPNMPSRVDGNNKLKPSVRSPVCPSGEVAMPKETKGPKRHSSRLIKQTDQLSPPVTGRYYFGGYYYSWSKGVQNVKGMRVTSLFADQTNEKPWINYTTSKFNHSLGQIWAIDNSDSRGLTTIETGWTESLGQFGDVEPHFFVFHEDAGLLLGYAPNGGWVQYSNLVYPNMTVSHNDNFHRYGVQLYNGNWWVYYDGYWAGYYPAKAFPLHFPNYLTSIEAGGEVATVEENTWTDMGNAARRGTDPQAAMFNAVWMDTGLGPAFAKLSAYNSDPFSYITGNWYNGHPGPTFRYGGTGWH